MILCDTGPLLAAANADDSEHTVCLATLSDATGPLIVPAPIVTEVCYMLAKSGPDAEAAFLRSLAAEELTVEPLGPADYGRMADLVIQYGKFPLGAADASVIAVAERLGITTVATLDHRHFRQVTPHHCVALELVPDEHELARHRPPRRDRTSAPAEPPALPWGEGHRLGHTHWPPNEGVERSHPRLVPRGRRPAPPGEARTACAASSGWPWSGPR